MQVRHVQDHTPDPRVQGRPRIRRTVLRCTAVLAAAALAGTSPAAAIAATDRPAPDHDLQQALDAVVDAGALGAQARVIADGDRWSGTSGSATLSSDRPVPSDGRFRVGSVTKTFVSTVLLQLVAEERISLDDAVEDHLPGVVPGGGDITVRHLLNHTSGIFNYTEDGEALPLTGSEWLEQVRFRTYAPAELAGIATAHDPYFAPGDGWYYSNTNYVLAGMIIESVTGNAYGDEVRDRIIEPLGLRHTSVPGTRTGIRGPHAHGYVTVADDDGERSVDVTRLNPSWAGAAGEMISTTRDLNRFYTALFGGELLAAEQLDAMLTTVPVEGGAASYGLGVSRYEASCGVVLQGHNGGIHGYSTVSAHSADGRSHVTVSVTTPGDVEGPAAFDAVQRLVDTVACD